MQVSTRPPITAPRMVAILFIIAALAAAAVIAVMTMRDDSTSSDVASVSQAEPAVVEHIEDSELSQITLTERAAERLQIETAAVSTEQGSLVVPYSAVYYAPNGDAWVYTSPEPLVFVRHAITVDRIEGDKAFLTKGPSADTTVVTVGVPELYGTEFEIGH